MKGAGAHPTIPINAVAIPVEMAVAATMLSEGMPVLLPDDAPERMTESKAGAWGNFINTIYSLEACSAVS